MFQDPSMRRVGTLVGVAAILALLAYTYYAITQAQYVHTGPTVINVTGKGEVFAKPDIATFSFSVVAREEDVVATQSKSAESINAILDYLESEGVEERDIKTQYYNLSPRYEYPRPVCNSLGFCPPVEGEPKLIGYEANQTILVKVRDTENAGSLIAGVGERGATNVSGLSFTIDDEDALKAEAREAAIADAQAKAEVLANELGVRIVRIAGYWEEEGYPSPYYGLGGAEMKVMDAAVSIAPELPMGENTITSRVNISYEIR